MNALKKFGQVMKFVATFAVIIGALHAGITAMSDHWKANYKENE
jgi:hypothetical protein